MFRRRKDEAPDPRIKPGSLSAENGPSLSTVPPKPIPRPAPIPVSAVPSSGPAPALGLGAAKPTPLAPGAIPPRRPVEIVAQGPGGDAAKPVGGPAPSGAASAGAPGGDRSGVADGETKKLIVGREIRLSGEITSCDRLVVEGHVEAQLSQTRAIEITETGIFKGNAEIDDADIGGRFEGSLIVRQRLTIRRTGKVSGEVRYGQIEIEAGGEIAGEIQVIGGRNQPPIKIAAEGGGRGSEGPQD